MAVTLNATTLASALGATDTIVNLTSGATVLAGQVGYIDREAIRFQQAVGTSTTLWYCSRGQDGTPVEPHNSGANVKTGPAGYFYMTNPAGAANAATEVALPHINVYTGDVFDINANAWRQVGIGGVAQGTAVWP